MNIALIATFDGGPLTGPDGEVRLAAIRSFIAAHLDRARMLRRTLLPTRPGQGRTAWIEAHHFDVEDHLLLTAPGRSVIRGSLLLSLTCRIPRSAPS